MGHFATGVVGAAIAGGRTAVAIVGDGAMLMSNEVSTAVKTGAPAVWIVLNDSRYNMCEQGMAVLGLQADARIPPVDFAMFAQALGGPRRDSRVRNGSGWRARARHYSAQPVRPGCQDRSGLLLRHLWRVTAACAHKALAVKYRPSGTGYFFPKDALVFLPETSMEANTFATSAFISTPLQTAFEYLCLLPNLDEWTLGSRMQEQVDSDTWIGTASGYQHRLYYHVRRLQNSRFCGMEWQCGYEYKKYFKSYPVLLFPPEYIEPAQHRIRRLFPLGQRD